MTLGTRPTHEQAFLPGGGPSLLAVASSVYIVTLALQGECLWNPAPASKDAARGPQLGVYLASNPAQPGQNDTIPDIPEKGQ